MCKPTTLPLSCLDKINTNVPTQPNRQRFGIQTNQNPVSELNIFYPVCGSQYHSNQLFLLNLSIRTRFARYFSPNPRGVYLLSSSQINLNSVLKWHVSAILRSCGRQLHPLEWLKLQPGRDSQKKYTLWLAIIRQETSKVSSVKMWGISYPPEGNRSINRPTLVQRIRQQLNGRTNGQPDGLREEWEDVRLVEENTTKS